MMNFTKIDALGSVCIGFFLRVMLFAIALRQHGQQMELIEYV